MTSPEQTGCLVVDLESVPARGGQPAQVIKLGALRPDTKDELEVQTLTICVFGGDNPFAASLPPDVASCRANGACRNWKPATSG